MPTLERLDVHALRSVITTFRDTVRNHQGGLNRLNVYPVPDGDTGTNMARTLDSVVAEMEAAADDDLAATCDAISHGSLMGARGNSGVILSQVLRGLSATLKSRLVEPAGDSARAFAEALTEASTKAYEAVGKPIEGTILTVVRESAEAARASAADGAGLLEVLRAARAAGKQALDNTPELLPVLKDAGVVDAGGAGYLLLLDSALHVVGGDPLPDAPAEVDDDPAAAERAAAVAHRSSGVDGELDVSEQRYEVMYLMDLADASIGAFKEGWLAVGDSIVVVGGDGLWNCHVHTNDIGAAIEVALDLGGRPKQIRVTDLFEEVASEHAAREAALGVESLVEPVVTTARSRVSTGSTSGAAGLPPVTTAVVAVCNGEGLTELFGSLGVQGIVTGGQSLNPSTAELLDTVEHVNADQVVILPNNKNIIPVAEQVDALTSKTVLVVPTRTMPEALAALVVYDPEAGAAANAAEMVAAAESVASGEVTRAVRDSNSDAGPIHDGDWIGIVKGDGIVAVAGSPVGAATKLLDELIGDSGELLTIVTGDTADPADTVALTTWLAENHADVQVEVHPGGQPLYPFLFGVE
ncbi:MAG TPA: DAK2 domain-containing protein [Ilumatobacter sp.]|nr:DAK2 domain-containing protein [Ilumatobacter sp.]